MLLTNKVNVRQYNHSRSHLRCYRFQRSVDTKKKNLVLIASICSNNFRFIRRFSTIASITKSASWIPCSRLVVVTIFSIAFSMIDAFAYSKHRFDNTFLGYKQIINCDIPPLDLPWTAFLLIGPNCSRYVFPIYSELHQSCQPV